MSLFMSDAGGCSKSWEFSSRRVSSKEVKGRDVERISMTEREKERGEGMKQKAGCSSLTLLHRMSPAVGCGWF